MAAIAAEAGVALKTVYLAFETKSRLLRAVWDVLLRGPVDRPVADLPWYREVLEEPIPERVLRLNARNSRNAKWRIGGILRVIRDAAAVEADMAGLWHLIETDFYANQRAIVEVLAGKGALRSGLDVTTATDILWTLNHPDLWRLLVVVRGWTPDQYEDWFGGASCAQLLSPSPAPRAPPVSSCDPRQPSDTMANCRAIACRAVSRARDRASDGDGAGAGASTSSRSRTSSAETTAVLAASGASSAARRRSDAQSWSSS